MIKWLKENKWLALIIGFALLLRLAAMFFALPYSDVFGDELNHTIIAFKTLEAKSPVLTFADKAYLPPLFAYLLTPILALAGLVGIVFDYFKDIADFKAFVILWRDWFLIPGRILSALFGAATVFMLYKLAERLFNKKVAMLAAGLLAVDFLHVHESQIGHIWSVIAFIAVLTAYFLFRLYETGQLKWYYWSAGAIAIGYAFGQIPIIFYLLFIVVCWFRSRHNKERFLSRNFILSSIVCFSIVLLFTFLDLYTLYKHIYDLAFAAVKLLDLNQNILPSLSWYAPKLEVPFSFSANWLIILKSLFFDNPFLLLGSIFGTAVLLKKYRALKIGNILLFSFSWGLLIFFSVIFYHFPVRYVIPVIPFLAMFAAYFVFWLLEKQFFWPRRVWLVVFIILLGTYSFLASTLYSFKLLRSYTVSQAVEWFYQNIPSGERVVSDIYLNSNRASIEFLQTNNIFGWLDTRKKYLLTLKDEEFPQPNYFLIDTNLTDVLSLPPQERRADYALVFFYSRQDEQEKISILDSLGSSRELAAKFYPQEKKSVIKSLLNLEPHFFLKNIWESKFIGPNVEIYKLAK